MKLPAAIAISAAICVTAYAAPVEQPAAKASRGIAKAVNAPMLDLPYVLTWEKDPGLKSRDPFNTVLRFQDDSAPARRIAESVAEPRTPAEEEEFAAKAGSLVAEARSALAESDYKGAGDRIKSLDAMVSVPLVTDSARQALAAAAKEYAAVKAEFAKVRARAALTDALRIAARMQAYFDDGRYGDVVAAGVELEALNTDEGLKSVEVAPTAGEILARCDGLRKRAEVHMEFSKKEFSIDAVSHFPDGRSFAIVNGEVVGVGDAVESETTLASIEGSKVTFGYKGERISVGLSEAPEAVGAKRSKEGRAK